MKTGEFKSIAEIDCTSSLANRGSVYCETYSNDHDHMNSFEFEMIDVLKLIHKMAVEYQDIEAQNFIKNL